MDLIKIFKIWDDARENRSSSFRLKPLEVLDPKDSTYKNAVKYLINKRIELKLSIDDIANALGVSHDTVTAIECFRGSNNWLYIYALKYIFMRYDEHLLSKKGYIFYSGIKQ